MIYRIITALTFLAMFVGSVLLGGQLDRAPSAQAPIREASVRDQGYEARHARLIQTGDDGRPLYTVEAEAMQQLPNQGTVEFEQVRVGFRDDSGNLWNAWGDHGELGQATGQVDLVGNVQVAGLLPGTTDQAHLATERLHVDTQAQIVRSQETVTMTTSDQRSRLQSHGLRADLKSGHVLLESAVHGIFVP
jgi:LPS export ABC transporter protein LptC